MNWNYGPLGSAAVPSSAFRFIIRFLVLEEKRSERPGENGENLDFPAPHLLAAFAVSQNPPNLQTNSLADVDVCVYYVCVYYVL